MMDFILEAWVSSSIEAAKLGWVMGKGQHWEPGEKLKLLFAGYNGTRNLGSDVRVSEMLRQIRHILGADNTAFSVMTQNFRFTEGYMFKSKFANALTTMMIGSLGIAAAQNKLSVGYGAEAGHMDPLIAKMCARYCQNSLVITRNEESRTILRELG